MTERPAHAGDLLRQWRQRRRLSQLDLALAADVSSRHLSFVETGRSRPTSDMILRLAEHLDVPLRDRNALLLAGGRGPRPPQPAPRPQRAAAGGRLRPGLPRARPGRARTASGPQGPAKGPQGPRALPGRGG